MLMALGLSRALTDGKRKAFQRGAAATAILMGLVLLALIYAQGVGYEGFRTYSQPIKAVMAVAGIAFMVCFCFAAMYTRYNRSRILWIGLALLLLFFVVHFSIPDGVLEESDPGRLLRENQARIGSDAVVISCEEAVSAVCWNLNGMRSICWRTLYENPGCG